MVNPQPASSKYKQSHLPYDVGIVAFFAFFEVCPILPRKNETPFAMLFCCYTFNLTINRKKKQTWALYTCNLWQHHPLKLPPRKPEEKRTQSMDFDNTTDLSPIGEIGRVVFLFHRFGVAVSWRIENVGVVILWWHGCCFKRPWTCSKKKRWIWGIQMVSWSAFLVVTRYDCTCGSIDMFPWADLWNETYSYSYDGNNTCQLRYTKP